MTLSRHTQTNNRSIGVRATMRVQNLAILKARERLGLTIELLCAAARVRVDTYYCLARFDLTQCKSRWFMDAAERLVAVLGIPFDEAVPPELLGKAIASRVSVDQQVAADSLIALNTTKRLVSEDPVAALEAKDSIESFRDLCEGLTGRMRDVMRARLRGDTLIAVGKELGISAERVRQVEAAACEKIRKIDEERGGNLKSWVKEST